MKLFAIAVFCLIFECHPSLALSSFKSRRKGGVLRPPPVPRDAVLPKAEWFDQKLDHFDPTNLQTWKQRYFTNDTFYVPGGPVFLMIGGEGPASPNWMVTGSWIEYAKKLNAFCLMLEHRFYGESQPTKDASVKNLRFLTTEQALADLASFTEGMKEALNLTDNKWVTFGGSYPGTLSAWFRLKYPHLVHAAVSTSAPIVAQTDFREYLEVVDSALKTTGSQCSANIEKANHQLDMLLMHRVGWQMVTREFKLCSPLNGKEKRDVANLYASLAGNFEGVVQYNKDNREFEGVKGTNITIDVLCNIMGNASLGQPIQRYAAVNLLMLETQDEKCLDHTYSSFIHDMQQVNWANNSAVGGRAWTYQTCTEYGFYQGSDSPNQPFGDEFPLKFYTKQCRDIFGKNFDENLINAGVKRTNMLYGGRDLHVKKVVFVNGSIDPWHKLGITSSSNSDMPAIFINGTAHCANMYPASPNDLPELVESRKTVFNHIKQWLEE
ncbi:putative serine protease K12H4.7 [Oratosquilla oratoria]|uniref:putative serine protease K12H4.7 n=1 Tax=Oratosquilla oratoria TaxID=337810 RepID=UPI003F776B0D